MKKVSKLSVAVAMFVASTMFVQAQNVKNKLSSQDFWKEKPTVEQVKAELAKGFDFKEVKGPTDPIFIAINNAAPTETIKYLIDLPETDLKTITVEGRIYLHSAVSKGNPEITEYLIKKGSDIHFLDANGQTAISYTAYLGSLTIPVIEAYIKGGFDVKSTFAAKDDVNLLLMAVGSDKDLKTTDLLISKGVSLFSTDKNGNTAFNYAARMGDIDVMKALLKRGVKYNDNALIMAAQGTFRTANKLETYQYLVDELKLNPLVKSSTGQNILHLITRKQNQSVNIKYFVTKGVDINQTDKENNTPFISAAGIKDIEVISLMLPKVKNINAVNDKGETALVNAARTSTSEVIELLLKNGANINYVDAKGNNLVYHLVDAYRPLNSGRFSRPLAEGQPKPDDELADKLRTLQNKGLNITSAQKDGSTLYHLAVLKNDIALLEKIKNLGVDINAKDKEGTTALHKAASIAKDDAILKFLLANGADKKIDNAFGESVYEIAKENSALVKNNVSVEFLK